MSTTAIRTVLAVDDDPLLLAGYQRGFARAQCRVLTATTAAAAVRLSTVDRPELAVVDLRLGADWGIDLVRHLKEAIPEIILVMVSGYPSMSFAVGALRAGANHVLAKPVTATQILQEVEQAPIIAEPEREWTPSLARVEWEHLMRVLGDAKGNISEAARRLNMHRQSLQRLLRKPEPTN